MNIAQTFGRSLRPPPRVSVAEWADRFRILPSETSAEPGRWRTDRTPYMRELLDALTPGSGVRAVYIMASAQMGKSEVINNTIGHSIHVDPAPILVVQPTEDMARAWSDERLTPMIRAVPQLAELFGPSKRNPDNKTMYKRFPGGFLSMAYASSAAQLASRPIRRALLDEVDRYPGNVGGEGDPVDLAVRRTQTFGDRALVIATSTPTIKGASRIEALYKSGDQRRYHLPCPHCGAGFVPEFDMLVREPDATYLECPRCHALIDESDRGAMLDAGYWVAENSDAPKGVRSYHFSALIAPPGWISWADILDLHDKALAEESVEADDKMRAFWNTVLGLPYEGAESEQADWERLYLRREKRPQGVVPVDVAVLTAGADVQHDRIEVEIVGWGEGLRSWSVAYLTLYGDPEQDDVWFQLDEVLDAEWGGAEGALYSISRIAIDTGFMTNSVYQWAHRRGRRLVMPVKGASHKMATLFAAPSPVDVDVGGRRIKHGVQVWRLNVDALKDHLKRWLELPLPEEDAELPARWCSWPEYDENYFKGLCGERKVRRGKAFVWEVVHRRQEPLDCRVYNIAAALSLRLDRWTPERWAEAMNDVRRASKRGGEVDPAVRKPRPATEPDEQGTPRRRYRDSSWLR